MMSASAEDEVIPAPPQPPSPLPDEPFFAPTIVHGIDGDDLEETSAEPKDAMSDLFANLSSRWSDAVQVSKKAVVSVVPGISREASIPSVLFFGDSITELGNVVSDDTGPGWVAHLSDSFAGRVDCFARGFSGYNTKWALHILPKVMQGLPGTSGLKAVTIFFGANDATIDGDRQHVGLADYKINLRRLVNFVRKVRTGSDPVVPILIAPPPVQEIKVGPCNEDGTGDQTRFRDRTGEYARACVAVAEQLACPVVDLYSAFVEKIREENGADVDLENALDDYLCDGIHLNANGNKILAQLVLQKLKTSAGLDPDVLKRPFPPWREVDSENPATSLGSSPLV